MNRTKASVADPGHAQYMSPTTTNISGMRDSVMALGRFTGCP
jgi:hypothetical protein